MRSTQKSVLQLQWEAPAGRQPRQKIIMVIDELEAAGKGLLGSIENHPSLAHSMPNPMQMRGPVIRHPADWTADQVTLRYPNYKMKDAKVKDRIALAIVPNNVCICIAPVPADVAEPQLNGWLEQWSCAE